MLSLEQPYQQVILDHARARHGLDTAEDVDASSHQINSTCGNEVTLGVQLASDGVIEWIVWNGDGYSISQVSLLMLAELVDKRPSIGEVAEVYGAMEQMMHSRDHGAPEEALDLLGDAAASESTFQFANRAKCAPFGWYALRDALAKFGTDTAGDRA